MMKRLINRLHRVFDKEPRPAAAVSISTPCTITVANGKAVVTAAAATHTVVTDGITLQQFVTALAEIGIVASVTTELQILSAMGLLDTENQSISSDPHLYYSANQFYQEMQVYGWIATEQANRVLEGERQAYLHSAEADWLDFWGKEYLGVARDKEGFSNDNTYRRQIIATILNPTQNNKVMERALKTALGAIDCTVVDAHAEDGFSLKYDGSELFTGSSRYAYRYGSQPGCFYITTDLPTEDIYPLDYITKTLVTTANKIKAAGTKLDGVRYKTSTSDTITITEQTAINATDGQADIFPWGLRYDGSVQHNSGRLLVYNGADSYAGETTFNGAVAGAVTYSNAWDIAQSSGHTTATDQQQTVIQYNGLASYDGVFDHGATPPPLYDTRMTVTVRRHNLYSGMRTYGADKQYDGSVMADGTTDYSQMRYEGIHTIQEMTI